MCARGAVPVALKAGGGVGSRVVGGGLVRGDGRLPVVDDGGAAGYSGRRRRGWPGSGDRGGWCCRGSGAVCGAGEPGVVAVPPAGEVAVLPDRAPAFDPARGASWGLSHAARGRGPVRSHRRVSVGGAVLVALHEDRGAGGALIPELPSRRDPSRRRRAGSDR